MQTTQDEVMEMLADDQMKHAEAPSDETLDEMHAVLVEDHDWAKERQLTELRVEEMYGYKPRRTRYDHEQTAQENTAEQLAGIERENVESSQARINYHE